MSALRLGHTWRQLCRVSFQIIGVLVFVESAASLTSVLHREDVQ